MRFQHNPFTDKLDISGMGPGTTSVDFVTGNSGGPVAADASYNINIIGDNTSGIDTVGNLSPSTLTIFGLASTTTQVGTTRYATNGEAAAQSSSTVALTPSNITSLFSSTPLPASQGGTGLSSPAAHSLLVTNGSSAFTALGTASNGQIPIGSIGSDPVLANITSLGGTISITNGPGSINLEQFGGGGDVVGPGSATDNAIARYDGITGKLIQNSTVIVSDVGNIFTPDSLYVGTATPSNPFDITIEKSVSGLIGSSIQNASNNAAAGSVQEIIVQTATADAYTEYVVNGATTWSTGIDNSDSDKYKITTGSSPSAGTAAVSIDTSGVVSLSTPLGIASGGTGASSFNINGVVISNTTTTGSLASLTLTNGQMVIGSTGAAPVAGTITSTDSSITVSTGAGTLNLAVAGGTTTGKTITGNSGGALSPTAGNWNILGTGSITTSGTGSTLTPQLTGLTNHNVLIGAGTATITNVAPSATSGIPLISQGAASDPAFGTALVPGGGTGQVTLTNHGVLVGAGTSAITQLAVGTDGQVLIGATGADPAFAALTSSDSSIAFTTGVNTLSLQVAGGSTTIKTITGNSGGAESPSSGNFNILGTGSITVAGSANTETVQLTGLTNHAIQIGAGTATLTQLGAGTTGQVLQTNTTADPTWSTATYPSTATGTGTILRADGTNWVATTATYPATTTINQLLYSSANNTIAGLATANRGVLTTGATGVPAVTALATDGQLIIGSTAGAPAAATLSAGTGIAITNGSNSISLAVNGSVVGQTITGNSGGALSPTAGNWNITGTGSITTAGSGSTLTPQLTGLTNHNVLIGAGTATITNVAPSATSGVPLISQGASSDPVFGTAVVAGGGTGAVSFTANGAVISNTTTTGALASVGLSNQQFLVGNTSAAPTAKALSVVIQTFSADGTYTPTSGMVYCIIECVGGGGAGGGSPTTGAGAFSCGGGGGGGEYARGVFSASSVGASKTITIGTAGSGSAGVGGNNGGTTTVGATLISAVGGTGGGASVASTTAFGTGGGGGSGGTGGSFRMPGAPGSAGIGTTGGGYSVGGNGGFSHLGGNGGGGTLTGAGGSGGTGGAGGNYGNGGGGSSNAASQASTRTGGAGTVGLVVVTEFVIA